MEGGLLIFVNSQSVWKAAWEVIPHNPAPPSPGARPSLAPHTPPPPPPPTHNQPQRSSVPRIGDEKKNYAAGGIEPPSVN